MHCRVGERREAPRLESTTRRLRPWQRARWETLSKKQRCLLPQRTLLGYLGDANEHRHLPPTVDGALCQLVHQTTDDAIRVPTSRGHEKALPPPEKKRSMLLQLLPGGLAGAMAQSIVQPVETVKVRLQLEAHQIRGATSKQYGGVLNGFRRIITEEGALALWKGLTPAALRELSYSSLRFGLYKPIKEALQTKGEAPSLWKMLLAGGGAGGIAAVLANPTDVLKARMQGDGGAARSIVSHSQEVLRLHGVLGFWRGYEATVCRAVILNGVKLATYDTLKGALDRYCGLRRGTDANTFLASFLTGTNVVLCSAPADFVRTQAMCAPPGTSTWAALSGAVAEKGPFVLWRGAFASWLRVAPYSVLQFHFMEHIADALGTKMT